MSTTDNIHPEPADALVAFQHEDGPSAADTAPDLAPADGRGSTPFPEAYRHHPSFIAARAADEEGSLVTEYGLLAVVAATICGVVIQWASGGAIVRLFNGLLNHAREIVGA